MLSFDQKSGCKGRQENNLIISMAMALAQRLMLFMILCYP